MEKIKLHDLKRISDYIKKDLDKAYQNCIEESMYLRGPQVRQFEEKWIQYTGAEDCATLTSGTDALHTAGMIANIQPGDEVILPAHTFVATAEAFMNLGATLRYVDCKISDYGIEEYAIDEKITAKTKAIVWTDVNGQTPDVDIIKMIAKRHNIMTICDAAASHGSKYKNKMSGTLADITAFSFGPVKPLGAIGGAGAVTGSKEVCRRAREIRNHGRTVLSDEANQGAVPREQRDSVGDKIGWNRNMHTIQAGFLLAKLPYLNELNDMKRQHAFRYNKILADIVEHVPEECKDRYHVYHLYSILSSHREELRKHLHNSSIESLIHWKIPVNQHPFFTQYSNSLLPISNQIAEQTLSLPCSPFLRRDEQDYICDKIMEFYHNLNK